MEDRLEKLFEELNRIIKEYVSRSGPEGAKEIYEVVFKNIIQPRGDYSSWGEIEREANVQGIPPLEYVVSVKRYADYTDIAKVWSLHYEVPLMGAVRQADLFAVNHSVGLLRDGKVITWHPGYAKAIREKEEKLKKLGFEEVYLAPLPIFEKREGAVSEIEEEFFSILTEARKLEATDIHFEVKQRRGATFVELKYRIMGELRDSGKTYNIDRYKALLHNIKNRIKDPPNFNAEEYYDVQDGKISLPERNLELRLAFTPSVDLEARVQNLVIRILAKDTLRIDREHPERTFLDLGVLEQDVSVLLSQRFFTRGLVLTSGETGSGKSTLISALVSSLPSNRKVLTAEDPVEYVIENAVQHNVFHMEIADRIYNLDYTTYIRAFMRMDPDVIFLGEWRKDPELTKAMLYAVQTGHLVFTTLHASRVSVIPNLLETAYEVSKEDIAYLVRFLMNQKLVKRVCDCAFEEELTEKHLAPVLDLDFKDVDSLRDLIGMKIKKVNPKGCPKCRKTDEKGRIISAGYLGRTLVYEYLFVDGEVQELLSGGATPGEVEEMMLKKSGESFRSLESPKARTYVGTVKEKVLKGEIDLYGLYHGLGYFAYEEGEAE